MKTQRICNVFSLIINLSIVYFTISGIAYSFRTDVIIDDPWYGFVGFASLKFFTNLSNILVAIASFIMVIFNIKSLLKDRREYPDWALILKYLATVAVAVTFVTVVLFLGPGSIAEGRSYFEMFAHNNFFLHFFTPVLAVVSFVLFEKIDYFQFRDALWGVLPVLLYAIVYFFMVVVVGTEYGGWPDFYGFTFGGNFIAAVCSCIVMLSGTWGISLLIRYMQQKFSLRKGTIFKGVPKKKKEGE